MDATLLLDHEALEPTARTGLRSLVRALLRVSGSPPADEGRIPLNLSLVLDRSGSMAGPKLEAAAEAAATLIRRLRPEDVVSVVTYDDQVTTVAEPGRGSDHAQLSRRIETIGPGGTTNLSGGWLRGRELVESGFRDGGVNRILLLTDGLANQGITDPGTLAGLCAEARTHGITTTTLGFGEGFDEALLRSMADAGGGNTYYIERPDQAGDVFGEELEGLLSLSAQNLVVEVRPTAAAEIAVVHHSYPRKRLARGLRLELGDLYAREPRDLLVELAVRIPEDDEGADAVDVAEILIRGDVLTPEGGVVHRSLALPIQVVPGAGPRVEPEVRRQIVLLEAARIREEALEARKRGEADEGGRLLMLAAERLERFADEGGAPEPEASELREEARELEELARRCEEERVSEADAKYLYQSAYDAGRSRWGARKRMGRGEGE